MIKYPRTYHLYNSEGCTSDDKKHDYYWNLNGKVIVITEKMDGENTTMMKDCIYARSIDSNNHSSRNYVKGMWGNIKNDIPDNFRICGENLYAKHSIQYDNLESYFLVFSIWNGNTCLNWQETLQWCELLNLTTVPVLYYGDYCDLKHFSNKIDTTIQEGFVVRNAGEFELNDFKDNVAKWVRKNHVSTSKHWMSNKIIPNKLKQL